MLGTCMNSLNMFLLQDKRRALHDQRFLKKLKCFQAIQLIYLRYCTCVHQTTILSGDNIPLPTFHVGRS